MLDQLEHCLSAHTIVSSRHRFTIQTWEVTVPRLVVWTVHTPIYIQIGNLPTFPSPPLELDNKSNLNQNIKSKTPNNNI